MRSVVIPRGGLPRVGSGLLLDASRVPAKVETIQLTEAEVQLAAQALGCVLVPAEAMNRIYAEQPVAPDVPVLTSPDDTMPVVRQHLASLIARTIAPRLGITQSPTALPPASQGLLFRTEIDVMFPTSVEISRRMARDRAQTRPPAPRAH